MNMLMPVLLALALAAALSDEVSVLLTNSVAKNMPCSRTCDHS